MLSRQTTQNTAKQNYPGGLIAFYDIRPGNEVGLYYCTPEPTHLDRMTVYLRTWMYVCILYNATDTRRLEREGERRYMSLYLVDVNDHVDLERKHVIQLNILFAIEYLKCLADADRAAKHVWWLTSRTYSNKSSSVDAAALDLYYKCANTPCRHTDTSIQTNTTCKAQVITIVVVNGWATKHSSNFKADDTPPTKVCQHLFVNICWSCGSDAACHESSPPFCCPTFPCTCRVGARWPSGTVLDLRPRGCGFESHQRLLCTNANSACHPSGVG